MPLSQQIMWTIIPRGFNEAGTHLRCSLVVSPRLRSTDTLMKQLSQYPDWLDWPQTLQNVSISIRFSNGTVIDPSGYTRISAPDSTAWTSIFVDKTPVKPYQFPMVADLPISSYPVMPAVEFLQQLYQSFGVNSPDTVPEFPANPDQQIPGWLSDAVNSLIRLNLDNGNLWREKKQQMRRDLLKNGAFNWENPSHQEAFEWAQYFHEPMSAPSPPEPNPTYDKAYSPYVRADIAKPKPDFHEIISVLLNHPILMQKLGVILIYEFPLPAGIPSSGWIQAIVSWSPSLPTEDLTPRMEYQLQTTKKRFLAKPAAGSDIEDGQISLQNGRYAFISFDPDAAIRKTLGFASSLRRIRDGIPAPFQTDVRLGGIQQVDPESRTAATPALQSVGFMLIRKNVAFLLKQTFQRAKVKNASIQSHPHDEMLTADDVLRGYRIDVWDSITGQWHSLCKREASYTLLRSSAVITGADEGTLTLTPVGRADADPDELRLHESLAVWKGWSLAVQRPGRTIDTEDEPADPANDPLDDYQVKVEFDVPPGSLPRLRFGQQYRFRLRAVDLAGYSLSLEELDPNDFSKSSPLLPYRRWEPVPNPALLLRTPLDPVDNAGESLEILAIRYIHNSPEVLNPTTQTAQRHIAAPRGSVELSEHHGKLDTGPGNTMDPNTYSMLVTRENTLPGGSAVFPETEWTNPRTGEKVKYPIWNNDQVVVPYLPDPLARAAVFHNVPGLPNGKVLWIEPDGTVTTLSISLLNKNGVVVNFGSDADWPDLKGFRLILAEGNTQPQWDNSNRTLTIFLPKGEEKTILYSCAIGGSPGEADTNKNLFGLWHLISQGLPPVVAQKVLDSVIHGFHWMITPPRKLTLVHAVSRPLMIPKITDINASPRAYGKTQATLTADITIDGKSTGKLSISARWQVPEDNPAETEPKDGKDGRDAPPEQKATIKEMNLTNPDENTLPNVLLQHNFGDTKYRRVQYFPTGVSRYREFFDPTLSEENFSWQGVERSVEILNAARPAGAIVPYAIPAFRWERVQNGNIYISTRKTLTRIYIERPWYSSGEGELLGILLPDAGGTGSQNGGKAILNKFAAKLFGGTTLPPQLQPYVTQWGLDPVWISEPVPTDLAPTPVLFEDVLQTASHLTLEELAGTSHTVTVVAYEPKYDPERQLWYVDVRLLPGESYFPFVKFAVARYQPKSIPNAHLSRVTALEFLQILPDRIATVVKEGAKLRLQVEGHTYRAAYAVHANSEMEATVEVHRNDMPSEFAWEPVATIGLDRMESRTPGFWVGEIDLKEIGIMGAERIRVLFKEYEQWFADAPQQQNIELKLAAQGEFMKGTRLTRRLVYADAIEIV